MHQCSEVEDDDGEIAVVDCCFVMLAQLKKSSLSLIEGAIMGVSAAGVCGVDDSRGSSSNDLLYSVCTSPALELRILIT